MLRMTRTLLKPNENTNLATIPEELTFLMLSEQNSGNLDLIIVNIDGLSNTFIWKWKNREVYEAYVNNPIYINAKVNIDSYNTANGIVVTEVIEEIND